MSGTYVSSGYEGAKEQGEPDPFDPHKAKWRVVPDFPWGEDEHDDAKTISGTIVADERVIGIIRLPNRETLKWLRERVNQTPEKTDDDS
jgi:hypothetical protein